MSRFPLILLTFALIASELAFGGEVVVNCADGDKLESYRVGSEPTVSLAPGAGGAEKPANNLRLCDELGICYKALLGEKNAKAVAEIADSISSFQKRYAELMKKQQDAEKLKIAENLREQNLKLQAAITECRILRTQAAYLAKMDKPKLDTKKLELTYALNGPNKDKTSKNYDEQMFRDVIRLALKNGVDPYLAMAVLILENTPTSETANQYREGRGLMPIDALPAMEALGCAENVDSPNIQKYATNARRQELAHYTAAIQAANAESNRVTTQADDGFYPLQNAIDDKGIDLGPYYSELARGGCPKLPGLDPKSQKTLCSNPEYAKILAAPAKASLARKDLEKWESTLHPNPAYGPSIKAALTCGDDCRLVVIPQKKIPPTVDVSSESGKPSGTTFCSKATSYDHGAKPIFDVGVPGGGRCCVEAKHSDMDLPSDVEVDVKSALGINYLKKRVQDKIAEDKSLAFSLQRYNGTKKIGVTEQLKNKCLSGMHMGENPVYGARAADLVVNSLMNSPKIQHLVASSLSANQPPVQSIFCVKKGQGSHRIDQGEFLAEQKRYLLSKERAGVCGHLFK